MIYRREYFSVKGVKFIVPRVLFKPNALLPNHILEMASWTILGLASLALLSASDGGSLPLSSDSPGSGSSPSGAKEGHHRDKRSTQKDYQIECKPKSGETDEEWCKRTFTWKEGECEESYVTRVTYALKKYPRMSIWRDESKLDLTRNYVELMCKQKDGETSEKLCSRLMDQWNKEIPDDYVKRVSLMNSVMPELDCWLNEKYLIHTAKYYYLLHQRNPNEGDREYCGRILQRKPDETDYKYMKRIDIMMILFKDIKRMTHNVEYLDIIKEYYFMKCEQGPDEKDDVYFERVFAQGSKEGNMEWFERMNMMVALYPDSKIWYNKETLVYTKPYYKYMYKRDKDECDDDYYNRLTKQWDDEDEGHYCKRIDVIKEVHSDMDLWVKKVYLKYTAKYFKCLYGQKPEEDEHAYLSRVFKWECHESEKMYTDKIEIISYVCPNIEYVYMNDAYLPYTRNYYQIVLGQGWNETFEKYCDRVVMQKNNEKDEDYIKKMKLMYAMYPNMTIWHNKEALIYTKKYYQYYYQKNENECDEDYYNRTTEQWCEEEDIPYCKRMEVFHGVYSEMDLWKNVEYLKYTNKYMKYLYRQNSEEDDIPYYERMFKQPCSESDESYVKRMAIIYEVCPKIRPVYMDVKFLYITQGYHDMMYKRTPGEKDDDYYARLCQQNEGEKYEQYISKMNVINAMYADLPLWNNEYYLEYTKSYYQHKYKKCDDESETHYYMGLTDQWYKEDNEHYTKRIRVIRKVYPELNLWYEEDWLPFNAKYYTFYYGKKECEEEYDWFTRVLYKESDESMECYGKRMEILKNIYSKELDMAGFRSEEQLDITRNYMIYKYGKKDEETMNDYCMRIVTHYRDENDDEYVNRVKLIKACFPDYDCWTDPALYEMTQHFYKLYYSKEEVIDEECYYKSIFNKGDGETDDGYTKRIHIFWMTCPTDKVWYSTAHLCYTESYLQMQCARDSNESEVDWANRILAFPQEKTEEMCYNWIIILSKMLDTEQCEYLQNFEPTVEGSCMFTLDMDDDSSAEESSESCSKD